MKALKSGSIEGLSREELAKKLKHALGQRAPGSLIMLNPLAEKRYGMTYLELLARGEMKKLVEIVKESYPRAIVRSAVKTLIVDPIADVLDVDVNREIVVEMLLEGKFEEAKRLLWADEKTRSEEALKSLRRILSCLKLVDAINAKIYEFLARRAPSNSLVREALSYIADTSKLHYRIVSVASSELGIVLPEKLDELGGACEVSNSEAYMLALNIYNCIASSSCTMPPQRIMASLVALEEAIDARSYMKTLPTLLRFLRDKDKAELVEIVLSAILRSRESREFLVDAILGLQILKGASTTSYTAIEA